MDSQQAAAVSISQKGRIRPCQRFAGNGGNEQDVSFRVIEMGKSKWSP